MQFTHFPKCCGLGVISGLSSELNLTEYHPTKVTPAELKEYEDKALAAQVTMALIITAPSQRADGLLNENGWVQVFSFRNRNSRSRLTVWAKQVNKSYSWDASIEFLQEKS